MDRPQKKRAIILLEVIIGLSLLSILLTALFSYLVQSAKLEKKICLAREEINATAYLQNRLSSIFMLLDSSNPSCFYLEKESSPSLMIFYDHGVDPDPSFSGAFLSKIYLDEKKNLSLLHLPLGLEENFASRKEILLKSIQKIEFEFFKEVKPSQFEWISSWEKSEGTVPVMIRLKAYKKQSKDPILFAFSPLQSKPIATYLSKKKS